MKLVLLAGFLLVNGFIPLSGQDSSKVKKEIAIQLFVRGAYIDYDGCEMPGIGIRYGKHCAFGGPLFGYRFRWIYPAEGIFLGYSFYPQWQFKRLSGHAILHYQHSEYNRHYEFSVTGGYGLDFRLFDNLYLDQSFTVGAEGIYAPRSVDSYYYGNHSFDLITMLQFGLRYDINLRKSEKM
jgi:hypothetical protein